MPRSLDGVPTTGRALRADLLDERVDSLRRTRPWRAWGRLTRDARDSLFLLAVIGWTVLPHAAHLPAWCLAACAAVLLWRAQLALRAAPLPNRWVLVGLLGVASVLTLWSFGTLIGKDPGITLAVVLMGLKTLELRARRDAFVVFFLGFFLVLSQFFYSQSLAVAAAMVVSVWGLLTGLVLAHMPLGRPRLHVAIRLAGRMALLGAPLMVVLFVLFPRVPPLWSMPRDGSATTGLSDTLSLGDVASLAEDNSIALRVRFDGGRVPPRSALYFRGPVLSSYDGRTWGALRPTFAPSLMPHADLQVRGPVWRYEMTLEPQHLAVVPLLEAAPRAPDLGPAHRLHLQDDLQWVAAAPLDERLRFQAEAYPAYRHGPTQQVLGLQDDLDLPAGHNPGTLAWAAALRRDPRYATADGRTLVAALLSHIRQDGYSYSLHPGGDPRADPRTAIDDFWLRRKVGYCEHYAAAVAVVLRAMDIPARIVTGYQGGDAALIDGYHIVRQRDAHAWVEYWQPGSGWERADPTAAVAPERVLRGRDALADDAGALGADRGAGVLTLDAPWLRQWRSRWEAVDNRWNQWVLNYSNGTQMELLKAAGVHSPDRDDLVLLLAYAVTATAIAGAGWAWWERRRVDPWTRQLRRLRASLDAIGVATAAHDPPRTLARRVEAALGVTAAAPLVALLHQADEARYGRLARRRPDPRLVRRFTSVAQRLRHIGAP